MNFESSILGILEQTKAKIQANLQAKNINASGRTSASFHTVVREDSFLLVGGGGNTAPLPTLEIGRPAGRVPSGFYKILAKWSRDKGIAFATEKERMRFAYLLGQRISERGTLRNITNEDVYTTPVKEAVAELKKTISAEVHSYIKANTNL